MELEEQVKAPNRVLYLTASHKHSSHDEGGSINYEYYEFVKSTPYHKIVKCIKPHRLRYLTIVATCYGGALASSSSDISLSIIMDQFRDMNIGDQLSTEDYGSYTSTREKKEYRLIGYLV